jgi:CRISPR-associated protein Cas1
MQDLYGLPKLRDSLSYLYVEHAVIEQAGHAIELWQKEGRTLVPAASLCVLMLGPGTKISHAAVKVLADNGCSILWTGEEMTRFYAQGLGETRKAYHLLKQAELACDPEKHTRVCIRMYQKRFEEQLDPSLTLPQIRGLEGVRVRRAYKKASETYGVEWHGRVYDRFNWNSGDPINRALSAANATLNSVCHAAIVSGGYSPAIGFVHMGKQLSFVYDVADLYKADLTIPIAFSVVAEGKENVERRTRMACREKFREVKLLERILPDIDEILEVPPEPVNAGLDVDADPALPTDLWPDLVEESESTL